MSEECQYVPLQEGYGGFLEAVMQLTPVEDLVRLKAKLPKYVIPVIFLPGLMGSNLRMSKQRQEELKAKDNRAWRPDDSWSWALKFRKEPPDMRQSILDPDATEVDYYHGTPDPDPAKFDTSGDADKRHNNVPHHLQVSPLLVSDPDSSPYLENGPPTPTSPKSGAQKARWRGWSEVMFGSYGDVLKYLEKTLNGLQDGKAPCDGWRQVLEKEPRAWAKADPTGSSGAGGVTGAALTEGEVRRLVNGRFPVHAMGYNWLKSNYESAQVIAKRIETLITHYQNNTCLKCPGVILVTHSMGGLLARALCKEAVLSGKILGVYHGAMPTVGSAAAYKRMRSGTEGGAWWQIITNISAQVIGDNGPCVTAVLANAPGPLELLPFEAYGPGWLRVLNYDGKLLADWPGKRELTWAEEDLLQAARGPGDARLKRAAAAVSQFKTAEEEIYTQPDKNWWRLINPQWMDAAEKYKGNLQRAKEEFDFRIADVCKFQKSITDVTPPNSYASYGNDSGHKAYGEVTYRLTAPLPAKASCNPEEWTFESETGDNSTGEITVSSNGHKFTLHLVSPENDGDGTVPAVRSGAKAKTTQGVFEQTGYEHQGCFEDDDIVQPSLLYSIASMLLNTKYFKEGGQP